MTPLRRRSMLALPLLGLAPALPALADAPAPLAMVMNSGDASISIIDMTAQQVIRTIPTLREPSHWALTPDRSKLYIADASGNALFILNPLTGAPLGHVTIADPYQLGYTPDNKYLVVNALRLDHVDVYDGTSLALVKRFSPGKMPSHMDFSPDSRYSYNSCQGGDTLTQFDLSTMTQGWTTKVGPTPAGVLYLGGLILVCIMGSDHIAVLTPEGTILRRVTTGTGPHNLFLTPDGGTLYVTNRVGGTLVAIDPATLTISRTYSLPGGPDDMGIAPDGKLWIALRFVEQVAVLDPDTGHYDCIDVGRSPHGIFLNTELQKQGKLTAETL